jgi:hypothetical protein
MDEKLLKEAIEMGMSQHKIARHFDVSQTNVRHYLKKYNLITKQTEKEKANDKLCIHCQNILSGRQTMFCSKLCKSNSFYSNNKSSDDISWKVVRQRGRTKKNNLIQNNGGCLDCGYNKNSAAISFHHLDPSEKLFNINVNRFSNINDDKLDQELEKCEMLCMNCHMERESPNLEFDNPRVKHFSTTTGLQRKIKLINEFGKGCIKCGYNKNYRSLTFHHRDPVTKNYTLDMNICQCKSIEDLRLEAAKCDILCSNCHMETHYPHLTLN